MVSFLPDSVRVVLDVGCSSGLFLRTLSEMYGVETWGVDLLEQETLMFKPTHYIRQSIEDAMPSLPDGRFDAIVLNDVLEHLWNPGDVLCLLRQKLSPKGVIVASIPNVLHHSLLRGLLLGRDWEYQDYGILDRTHIRFFTRKSIIRLIESAGFEVRRIQGINGTRSWKLRAVVALSLGYFSETQWLQYGVVAVSNRVNLEQQ